jgi:5-methyltetrahydrofolate--homocysteine methyltransferase
LNTGPGTRQALGDRLAEAYAEKLHLDVRTTIWGYAPEEKLDTDDLLKVRVLASQACGF